MSIPPKSAVDLDQVFETMVDTQIDTMIDIAKDVWKSTVEDAEQHIEAIKKYQELIQKHHNELEDCFSAARGTETKARDRLVSMFGADRVLPRWEAEGDLTPPSLRQALLDHNALPAQPTPVSPPSAQVRPQQPRTPDTPDPSLQEEDTVESPVSNPQAKRPSTESQASSTEPPSKRTRRSLGASSSKLTAEPGASSKSRTIPLYMVVGEHWAFEYPSVGPGYFVLLCNDSFELAHHFKDNPLCASRGIRHFASKDSKCHKHIEGLPAKLSERELVERFGYQVEEMTDQECDDSNQRIVDKRHSSNSAKVPNKKPTEDTPRSTGPDLPKTRSSRPYGKPEIQPITRSAGGSAAEAKIWYEFDGEEVPPVRSDLV